MKKIFILTMSLMLIVLLATGCDNSEVEVPGIDLSEDAEEIDVIEVEGGTKINYAFEDEVEIFGNLSREEIDEIIDEIFAKVANDDNFENNIDLIIEKVFKEYGITDEDNLDAAKSKLNISKTK